MRLHRGGRRGGDRSPVRCRAVPGTPGGLLHSRHATRAAARAAGAVVRAGAFAARRRARQRIRLADGRRSGHRQDHAGAPVRRGRVGPGAAARGRLRRARHASAVGAVARPGAGARASVRVAAGRRRPSSGRVRGAASDPARGFAPHAARARGPALGGRGHPRPVALRGAPGARGAGAGGRHLPGRRDRSAASVADRAR